MYKLFSCHILILFQSQKKSNVGYILSFKNMVELMFLEISARRFLRMT